MKTKTLPGLIVCLIILTLALVGCSKDKPKPGYRPQGEIDNQLSYHYTEAVRDLKRAKKLTPESYLSLADFWQHVNVAELPVDTFEIDEEELDSLKVNCYRVATEFVLRDLRGMKNDGNHQQKADRIHLYSTESGLSLEELGTTEDELKDLVFNNTKSEIRRIVAELRQRREAKTLGDIDVYDYADRIRSLSDEIETPMEVCGITEAELEEIVFISIGE